MKVEIWSDIVCPFCYIGKRKFENALKGFTQKENVEVVWRSFQLDPDLKPIPGQSVHEYLAKRKGVTTAEGKRMNDSMSQMAKEVGLNYNFDEAVINNTLDAHRLSHLALQQGLQNEVEEKLFASYYTEGKDIGDVETLVQIGESAGLKGIEIRNMLHSDDFVQAVQLDQYESQQVGVRGVPFFVFNDKYAVSGAQPSEVFTQVLNKVWEEENPAPVQQQAVGVCSADGICN